MIKKKRPPPCLLFRNKRIVLQVKSQRQCRRPCDPDSRARNRWPMLSTKSPCGWIPGDEKRGVRVAQIDAILATVDFHRLAQFGGSIRQLPQFVNAASPAQNCLSDRGFECANENCLANPRRPANGVDAEMATVNEINVAMPRLAKHHTVARRLPRKTVAGRVAREIRLGLDDRPAAGTGRRIADQPVSKQSRRHNLRRGFVEASQERGEIIHLHLLLQNV